MNGLVRFVVLFIGVLAAVISLNGCFGLSQDPVKKSVPIPETALLNKSEKPASSTELTLTPKIDDFQGESGKDQGSSYTLGSKKKTFSEKEKVKQIAAELAAKYPAVKKIKICQDRKNSEWWFTFFEDFGDILDIKQYVWKIDQDNAEPFLVIKRIAKSQLQNYLNSSEQNRTCTIVEQGPQGWEKLLASSFDTDAGKSPKKNEAPEKKELKLSRTPKVQEPAQSKESVGQKLDLNKKQRQFVPEQNHAAEDSDNRNKPKSLNTRSISSKETRTTPREQIPSVAPKQVKEELQKQEGSATRFVQASSAGDALISGQAVSKSIKTISDENVPKPVRTAKLDPSYDIPEPSIKMPARNKSPLHNDRSKPCYVFVYGTDMNHQDLIHWLSENNFEESVVREAFPAVLEDYDYVWNYFSPSRSGGAVNLEERRNSRVYGLLLEIEDSALKAFDLKAGHPAYYTRGEDRFPIRKLDDDSIIPAWVYTAKPNRSGRKNVWPTRDYKQKILEAAIFWQFPAEYIGRINDWPTNN